MKVVNRTTKINHPTKRTRRITTVNDILARDDVNGILADLAKEKHKIAAMIVIYANKDGQYGWQVTENTLEATIVWLLESIKRDIMTDEE